MSFFIESECLSMLMQADITDYRLHRLLGEGGFARVHLARDTVRSTDVALKILKSDFDSAQTIVDSFFRDADLVRTVEHKNIVRVVDIGPRTRHPFFFAMEYCHGGDLRSRIRTNGPLPILSALTVAAKACSALLVIHSRGLVHRDIKASNVLFRNDGEPVLTDFGIAVNGALKSAGFPVVADAGSPPYLAPEIWSDGPDAAENPAADMYAFGVLLYYALTGVFPFSAGSAAEYGKLHLYLTPVRPSKRRPGIARELDGVVLTLLEKRPENRIPSAELERLLRRALELSNKEHHS